MSKQLKRYNHSEIIEHLSSQYVLGTLSSKVRARVEKLAQGIPELDESMHYWQNRLVNLDQQTPALPASEAAWQNINAKLFEQNKSPKQKPTTLWSYIKTRYISSIGTQWLSAFCLCFVLIFSYQQFNHVPADNLSYVAVLNSEDNKAHLVATTYGESQTFVLNIIDKPQVDEEQSLELWVISKTDQQVRSLGILPTDSNLLEKQLSNAQWRLIKDSHSLIVTIEDEGGSAIGEPSDEIVSRGLCVRLQDWNNNV